MAARQLFFISVLLVLTQVVRRAVAAQQCTGVGSDKSILGWMLQGHIYKTMLAELPHTCVLSCRKDDRCQSFNWVISISMCEFSNRTKEARPDDFIQNPDRFYFRRDKNRVPLGSITELPAETCKEIKASEGQAISGNYWLYTVKPGVSVFAHCNMETNDANECSVSPSVCDINANCTNTRGSYFCTCMSGFSGGGKTCTDVDECIASSPVCDVNANCTNTRGSYLCTCKSGFSGDGKTCTASFRAVFTNLGASGRLGPTSLGGYYSGQDHDGQVKLVSGIQQWTVPYTGDYRIEAVGAAGGYGTNSNNGQYRGRGARMIGTFLLSQGETIQILVGQKGSINTNGPSSGGGGGTFVVRSSNNAPLIIAGGGGGMEGATSRHPECDASTGNAGRAGYKSWAGGSGGQGAQTADSGNSGGGGGGFYSNGRSSTQFGGPSGNGGEGGRGFLQGGVGGRAWYNNAVGGFGGGGGAYGSGGGAGGGGGYSGGSSGDNESDSCGGGGGSYNDGTNQQNECCYNTVGHGQVSIASI